MLLFLGRHPALREKLNRFARLLLPFQQKEQEGSCNKYRSVHTHESANEHGESEAMNTRTPEEVENSNYNERGKERQDGPTEGLVHTFVHDFPADIWQLSFDFTHSIENYNRVVNRITNQR